MDREQMSNEENYAFDVSGFLHVPGVLNRGEVEALNKALDEAGETEGMLGWSEGLRDPFRDLLVNPQLVWYLNQIVGPGFRLDTEPELLGSRPETVGGLLAGGNEPRDPGIAYYHQNGRRYSEGVRVIWVLEDVDEGDGGFVVVSQSHKSNVETPEGVLTGEDDMDLAEQPVLKAGDLLMVGLSVLQGVRPWRGGEPRRLLSYEYVGRGVIRTAGTGPKAEAEPRPEWHAELSPEQRAALYKPGYRDSTPPPTVVTDGENVQLDNAQQIFHPSIYKLDLDSNIDYNEFYFWDLKGYLVLRGVMDEDWLAAANEAVDKFEDQIRVGSELSGGSKSLVGTGRPTLSGLLSLPEPYCDPFRKMVAHRVVEHRLNWMGGSGGRMGGATAFCAVKGTSGHAQHNNGEPINPSRQHMYQNGRSYCQAVTATWQLRDVHEEDGGFACLPGSHKANYPVPPGVTTCDDHMGLVKHIGMKAGDVLFFMDGSTSHGTFAWTGDLDRRGILIKYSSRSFNRSGGELVQPENRWGDLVEGMTDAQLAVMRGPDRDVFGNNVPRLRIDDGVVDVSYERGSTLYSGETPKGPLDKK
ncbi:MAG: phytanoyl-CoA dioxygenase family protein [bacterium]|nr:phytanoyl-CoA dioxygenase family protein [bacterium]